MYARLKLLIKNIISNELNDKFLISLTNIAHTLYI